MSTKKPSWLSEVTSVDKPTTVEPFEPNQRGTLVEFNGFHVVAERSQGGKKVAFALRIDDHINQQLEKCSGSKNSVINALLEYALNDIKAKGKTLLSD